ncbi:MAG: polysaccharide biosynthesis C-terminal domain-containing protein [Clostridia bacterium]|nr:polysaccharide biosynthesis C-terminal domain-containing protein [Clostridia bacterium]
MDLLNGKIKSIYLKYFAAAFGSAFIASIYSLVDLAMVGHYHGPVGTAAMVVASPMWNILYSLGMLSGLGGAVLYSTEKGKGKSGNSVFTLSLLITAVFSLIAWIGLILFDTELMYLFGATEENLELALMYVKPFKFAVPLLIFSQFLSAFLRNDNDPGLATAAVLGGGIFNVFGDWLFVFALDMGILGAGTASVTGMLVTDAIMCTHFFKKKNTLKLEKISKPLKNTLSVIVTGAPSAFTDIAMGILNIIFNHQIVRYLNGDALAVYAVIVNISTFVQCCAYSVGQASQPIISINYGASKPKRISEILRYALISSAAFALFWTAIVFIIPNGFTYLFMTPTDGVLKVAPSILRAYSLSFLLLPFNIFATYYFQAVLKPGVSFIISLARGLVLSSALLILLPLISPSLLWYAMLVCEALTLIYVIVTMRSTRITDKK